jgi:ATP-dependent exoDNAse (exonuclease V) alpha subunit
VIAEGREIDWEQAHPGESYASMGKIPPCAYSINAFGLEEIKAYSKPPDFFHDNTQPRVWEVLPASICTWPYEAMYADEVKKPDGSWDNDKRLDAAREYFSGIDKGRSLIFYYANYSNPFSEDDKKVYAMVGLSRVIDIGEELFYEGCSEENKRKFGGGYVWERVVTSNYPDEGFRLPYHLYLDQPDQLKKFIYIPVNPRNFKYGTRYITDDDALDLVERFVEIANTLKEIRDTSEDWPRRIDWLYSVIASLWTNRGIYPGMTKVLDYLDFKDAIPFYKVLTEAGKEKETKDRIFAFLEGKLASITGLKFSQKNPDDIRRQWSLREKEEQHLLRDVLPLFDLTQTQVGQIMSQKRDEVCILASLPQIVEDPYILCEQYVGDGPDDIISFSKIDHGMFPSPELGVPAQCGKDDSRRLRALCVECLRRESQHSFVKATQVINDVNHKLSFMPEWKRHQFTAKYLIVDEKNLSEALTFREDNGERYIYLKNVYEDERAIEQQLRTLVKRSAISLKTPVTEANWHAFLYDPNSPIAEKRPGDYEKAIQQQVSVCQKVFRQPLSIISGGAGTGKTTIIKAIINAIEKAHGTGTSFQLLAPTGKAADRLREKTEKPVSTIHSFLAKRGWLNGNLTFRRNEKKEEGISTYIIDEASMLDLNLLATLFRAINWKSVQRLIFVGDPNQLPPIGVGKVFADLVDWILEANPDSLGMLQINLRQMKNHITGQGTAITELAGLYVRSKQPEIQKDGEAEARVENMLQRIQEGGDIDKDLRVLYWRDTDELERKLVETIVVDMEKDTNTKFDTRRPFDLWHKAFMSGSDRRQASYQQVISPYRGELFGTEYINSVLQQHSNHNTLENLGHLGGITIYDKVIQVRNKYKSDNNPLWAYNREFRKSEKVEVFNGEMGFAKVHGFDSGKWQKGGFYVRRFQVEFSRREKLWVNYESASAVEENLELAYAISVHKAQGSEFQRVYFVLPKYKRQLLTTELFYTGLTRAQTHCTLLVQEDISPLLTLRRRESSQLCRINSSLFCFRSIPDALLKQSEWYEEGKIHRTLTDEMVRSKSEVIIANMLFERDIPFKYDMPLYAPDGTFYLPDFTIKWNGEDWYWEHLGMMSNEAYRNHWATKLTWYEKNGFKDRLVTTTEEGGFDSKIALNVIEKHFGH